MYPQRVRFLRPPATHHGPTTPPPTPAPSLAASPAGRRLFSRLAATVDRLFSPLVAAARAAIAAEPASARPEVAALLCCSPPPPPVLPMQPACGALGDGRLSVRGPSASESYRASALGPWPADRGAGSRHCSRGGWGAGGDCGGGGWAHGLAETVLLQRDDSDDSAAAVGFCGHGDGGHGGEGGDGPVDWLLSAVEGGEGCGGGAAGAWAAEAVVGGCLDGDVDSGGEVGEMGCAVVWGRI